MSDQPVLIIDSLNLFMRAWAAFPTMSSHGYQMGGCVGFLKVLKKIVSEIQPSRVVLAWEGGGSSRRRKLLPEYKEKRRPEKLNRFYGDDIPDTDDNKNHQMITLINVLKNVPLCQVYVSDVEGDDIIAYLCCGPFRNDKKVIASSDKDMYQLLNDKTRIYSFHKKNYVDVDDVFEEFNIKPHNFAIAKALCGDPGDNIPGIKGFGFKTASVRFPFLSSDEHITIQDVLSYSASHLSESKYYQRVVESEDELKRNWDLVFLDGSAMAASQISRIENVLNTFSTKVNRMDFTKALLKEGINDFDVESFFYAFKCISNEMVNK